VNETETDQFDRDDELRAMLRAADPARSLAAADPAALARVLDDTMSSDLGAPLEVRSQRRRGPLTWLVAAAAAAVVATAGVGAVVHHSGGDGSSPAAGSHHSSTKPATNLSSTARPALTRLTASTVGGRCAAPSAEVIAATDTAFQGTVTAINGSTVTLQTTSVFHGQVGQTVEVTAPAGLGPLVRSVHFAVGGSYLVSASKGQVALCGFSGRATGNLASLYTQAFPR
jgi:hypothetical protein